MPSQKEVYFQYGKTTEYVRMFLRSPFLFLTLGHKEDIFEYIVEFSKDENKTLKMIFLRENDIAVGFTIDGKPTKCIRVYDQEGNLAYEGSYECYAIIDSLF